MTAELDTGKERAIEDPEKLSGLKGWLIFVGIGVVINPILLLFPVYHYITYLFSNQFLSSTFQIYFYFKAAEDIGLMIFGVVLAAFYFRKKRRFVQLFYINAGCSIFLTIISWLLSLHLNNSEDLQNTYIQTLWQAAVYYALWIQYFKVSKRVKYTFVN